jgi:hypothetical protein
MKTCTATDCVREAKAKGLCFLHYQRLRTHGDVTHVKTVLLVCSLPACGKPHLSLGYCSAHYALNKKYGEPVRRKFRKETTEQRRARMRLHYHNNKAYYKEKKQRREHRQKQSTPAWLSLELRNIMQEFYKQTPAGCEVDHITPLNGKTVCGLHVPWNLQYLPAAENRKKRDKLVDGTGGILCLS